MDVRTTKVRTKMCMLGVAREKTEYFRANRP
jgi:hypothetical protein